MVQARTNANDKMTVNDKTKQNIMHREKYSSINCAEWWIRAKGCPDLNCEVWDLLLEVADLKQKVPDPT